MQHLRGPCEPVVHPVAETHSGALDRVPLSLLILVVRIRLRTLQVNLANVVYFTSLVRSLHLVGLVKVVLPREPRVLVKDVVLVHLVPE